MENDLFKLKGHFMHLAENYYNKYSKQMYKDLTLTEVHCLASIASVSKPNVTQISLDMRMTKGAITKITSKLIKKNLLIKYNLPDNKKEVYFKLSPEGLDIYRVNQTRQGQIEQGERDFFDTFSQGDLATLVDFFHKYNTYIQEKIDALDQSPS